MEYGTGYDVEGTFSGPAHCEQSLKLSPGWTASDMVIDTVPFLSDKFMMSLELKEFICMLYYLHHVEHINGCIIIPEESSITKYHAKLRVSKAVSAYPSWTPIYYSIHRWNHIASLRTFNVSKMKFNKSRPTIPYSRALESKLQYTDKQYQSTFLLELFIDILSIDFCDFEQEYKKWNCTFTNIPKWDAYSLIRK